MRQRPLVMPYYATANGRVRLYHGDCRELLPIVAPPSKRVFVTADPPYGIKVDTKGRTRQHEIWRSGKRRARAIKDRDFPAVVGDDQPFDPSHLLTYPRLVLWGWNHYSSRLPEPKGVIAWDKKCGTDPDDGSDFEQGWTNLGGADRLCRHLWRGTCRASETGVEHLHPTQKPEELFRWLFAGRGRGKPVVRPGDVVVVPYCGSGPEVRPAMELGLEVVAIDVERAYLDTVIKHRIEPALKAARQLDLWAKSRPAKGHQKTIQIGE